MPLKIKSTSGSVTLDAQNVAGDQTLTVPSLSGGKTLLTTDGDGSNLTGVLSFGGDTFGADKTIGSNDNYALSLETNATERLKITSDGRGLSQFTAKAWVNFNGTGTVAIRDSHNVSSVTDHETGVYTINYSYNLANTNYSTTMASSGSSGYSADVLINYGVYAVSSQKIKLVRSDSQVRIDVDAICLQIFGD